jgi:hypothetical protein
MARRFQYSPHTYFDSIDCALLVLLLVAASESGATSSEGPGGAGGVWGGGGEAAAPTPPRIDEFLAGAGLACCVDVITKGGVDAPDDIRFLTNDLIQRLKLPPVKQNILMGLAADARERVQRDRERARESETRAHRDRMRRESWTRHWFENLLAALETMVRGFTLGFGLSFVYETVLLNRDFYTAVDDLHARVQRAALRAAVLGGAVATVMNGVSLFVPYRVRDRWVSGEVQ